MQNSGRISSCKITFLSHLPKLLIIAIRRNLVAIPHGCFIMKEQISFDIQFSLFEMDIRIENLTML